MLTKRGPLNDRKATSGRDLEGDKMLERVRSVKRDHTRSERI